MIALNPIIVKELRARMRGPRPYIVLTVFLSVLVAVGYGLYQVVLSQTRLGATVLSAQVGQVLFIGLAICELALVVFLAPGLSSGAISGEREQLTYEMLLATPLRPWQILAGKLVTSLSFLLLLIVASIPLFSMVLIFGGIAPKDLAKALAVVLVVCLLYGTLGVTCSALMRRTAQATVLAYGLVLALLFGTWALSWGWVALRTPLTGQPAPPMLLYMNPLAALASAVLPAPASNAFGGPMSIDQFTYGAGPLFAMIISSAVYYGPNGPVVMPLYRAALVLYPLVALALLWLSSHLVRLRRRWRLHRGDLGFALVVVIGLVVAYLTRAWWVVLPQL